MSIIYDEQERMLAFTEVAQDILRSAQTELYLNMRFLDVALSTLAFLPDSQIQTAGTDGVNLFFRPDQLSVLFRKSRVSVNRLYLHSILHCLFAHLWTRKDRDIEYWNLACDIAVESVIDGLYLNAVHSPMSALRRRFYRTLKDDIKAEDNITSPEKPCSTDTIVSVKSEERSANPVLTAQRIYRFFCNTHLIQAQLDQLKWEFTVDDHSRWEDEKKPSSPSPQQRHWEDIRDRMQTEMETFGKESTDDIRALEEQVFAANRKHYDYRDFLRKFSVLKEEMQVDMDSFDYIFYNYGMELYGNM
ncbi:MAG: metallopeptidase, partial [Clostridiales bacterium]|nr:metallopeptidase [Clostridiales bacterium]